MVSRMLIRSHTALRESALPGGADRLMRTLAKALSEGGWRVDVLCPRPEEGKAASIEGVQFTEFDYSTPRSAALKMIHSVRGARTFYDLSRRNDFDVILDDVSHIPFYPAHFLRPRTTVNALFVHGIYFGAARTYSGPVRGSVVDLIDRTLPYLDRPEIVCAGPGTETRIHDELDYRNTHVLRPCVDTTQYRYDFDQESKQLLYLGRLTERKNPSCLLDAWSTIEQRHDEYELVIAGTGGQETALKRKANELGIERIEFKGYVSEAQKIELFEQSVLYVLPSRLEGYVTTGLEALAAGTPVVGADVVGINDYVIDGETGFLFEDDNSDALAAVIDGLLRDPARLVPVAKRGREVAEHHSYESFRRNATDVFTKVLARNAERAEDSRSS